MTFEGVERTAGLGARGFSAREQCRRWECGISMNPDCAGRDRTYSDEITTSLQVRNKGGVELHILILCNEA